MEATSVFADGYIGLHRGILIDNTCLLLSDFSFSLFPVKNVLVFGVSAGLLKFTKAFVPYSASMPEEKNNVLVAFYLSLCA